jgi:hypothetical protein
MSADFVTELRAELVGAAHRLHRRRLRRRRIATRAAVVAAVVAIVGVGAGLAATTFEPAPASAGVHVETVDGRLILTVERVEVAPDSVVSALDDHGIEAEVRTVPVGPSQVGRFASGSFDPGPGVELLDPEDGTFSGFSIPVDYRGHIELELGRPARPGERYAGGDAFADGEPLACSGLYGQPLTAVAEYVAAHPDLRIRVEGAGDGGSLTAPTPIDDVIDGPMATWLVVRATPRSAHDVDVQVTPDGSDPMAHSPGYVPPDPPEPCDG